MSDAAPEPFSVECTREGDDVVVAPIGELDLETHPQVKAAVEEQRAQGAQRIVIDLRRTTFMDSSALHLMLELDTASRAEGFGFALVEGPPAVRRLFELTALHERLPFVDP
jgi:anti-sigma B factor antagonist